MYPDTKTADHLNQLYDKMAWDHALQIGRGLGQLIGHNSRELTVTAALTTAVILAGCEANSVKTPVQPETGNEKVIPYIDISSQTGSIDQKVINSLADSGIPVEKVRGLVTPGGQFATDGTNTIYVFAMDHKTPTGETETIWTVCPTLQTCDFVDPALVQQSLPYTGGVWTEPGYGSGNEYQDLAIPDLDYNASRNQFGLAENGQAGITLSFRSIKNGIIPGALQEIRVPNPSGDQQVAVTPTPDGTNSIQQFWKAIQDMFGPKVAYAEPLPQPTALKPTEAPTLIPFEQITRVSQLPILTREQLAAAEANLDFSDLTPAPLKNVVAVLGDGSMRITLIDGPSQNPWFKVESGANADSVDTYVIKMKGPQGQEIFFNGVDLYPPEYNLNILGALHNPKKIELFLDPSLDALFAQTSSPAEDSIKKIATEEKLPDIFQLLAAARGWEPGHEENFWNILMQLNGKYVPIKVVFEQKQ